MLQRLSIGLLASALALNPLPGRSQDGSADDLGVMSISLKEEIKPTIGFQAALQAAGTPNQAGLGGFLPVAVNDNSVIFLDALANFNFADRSNYSSIVDTTVKGTTISTSTRLGYRWQNEEDSWMYGLNAGYDSRPMNSGYADSGISVEDGSAFYQQIGFNLEAISSEWKFNAYGLIPVGETTQVLNWNYNGGALLTYGLDTGYWITSNLQANIGAYYQKGDYNKCKGRDEVNNVGLRSSLSYRITDGLDARINGSYDDSYDWRLSAALQYRFGADSAKLPKKQALISTPENRDIRVHDRAFTFMPIGRCRL